MWPMQVIKHNAMPTPMNAYMNLSSKQKNKIRKTPSTLLNFLLTKNIDKFAETKPPTYVICQAQ